eukprot:m.160413 g.160413  ORF g.160413 m.160413 type:complete len:346 (+) comp10274_c0_seq1:386-1423(+)
MAAPPSRSDDLNSRLAQAPAPASEMSTEGTTGSSSSAGGRGKKDVERRLRREMANYNERRRMQNINQGFEAIRALLPNQDPRWSKASVLCSAARFIADLLHENAELREAQGLPPRTQGVPPLAMLDDSAPMNAADSVSSAPATATEEATPAPSTAAISAGADNSRRRVVPAAAARAPSSTSLSSSNAPARRSTRRKRSRVSIASLSSDLSEDEYPEERQRSSPTLVAPPSPPAVAPLAAEQTPSRSLSPERPVVTSATASARIDAQTTAAQNLDIIFRAIEQVEREAQRSSSTSAPAKRKAAVLDEDAESSEPLSTPPAGCSPIKDHAGNDKAAGSHRSQRILEF